MQKKSKFSTTRVNDKLMHRLSVVTQLHIGIDRKHDRYYVCSNKNRDKYPVAEGVMCWIISGVFCILAIFAFLCVIGEPTEELTTGKFFFYKFVAMALMVLFGWIAFSLDEIFEKRPDWNQEDYIADAKDGYYWVQ